MSEPRRPMSRPPLTNRFVIFTARVPGSQNDLKIRSHIRSVQIIEEDTESYYTIIGGTRFNILSEDARRLINMMANPRYS